MKSKATAPVKRDIEREVTDRIIAALEAGTRPWRRDWAGGSTSGGLPVRANGETYKGINVLLLWMAAGAAGYASDLWMTYKQAKAEGAQVRGGEKGTEIVFAKPLTFRNKETGDEEKAFIYKTYTVFNAEQIDGLREGRGAAAAPKDNGARAIAEREAIFGALGMDLRIGGDRAYYHLLLDYVQMPAVAQFVSADAYYGTLAHETIHWTGAAGRLGRHAKTPESRAAYAYEELVAEIGACFLTSQIGGDFDLANSAAYISGWLKALQSDRKFVFKAASEASAAVEMILRKAGRLGQEAADAPDEEAGGEALAA